VQTFLPYADFAQSAKCLDYRRLGKQRVEAMQILSTLTGQSKGWRNHPAVKMWEGYEIALRLYHNIMIDEWVSRGYKNTMRHFRIIHSLCVMPHWLGDERVHSSHRANLLRKDPTSGYYWPPSIGSVVAFDTRPQI
jgi:hypothetical protein